MILTKFSVNHTTKTAELTFDGTSIGCLTLLYDYEQLQDINNMVNSYYSGCDGKAKADHTTLFNKIFIYSI